MAAPPLHGHVNSIIAIPESSQRKMAADAIPRQLTDSPKCECEEFKRIATNFYVPLQPLKIAAEQRSTKNMLSRYATSDCFLARYKSG